MKNTYDVCYTNNVESKTVFTSDNEAQAREFFEKERESLKSNTPADTSGWCDTDQAWKEVYFVELCKNEWNEDGELENTETDYYFA